MTDLPILVDGVKKNLTIIQRTSIRYTNLAMFLLNDDNCDMVDGFVIMTLRRLSELSIRSGSLVLEGNL